MMRLGLLMLLLGGSVQAVQLNQAGEGEVLLVPYFTVNNQLNTLVEVVNHSQWPTALKVNVRERLYGEAVLTYNVYLAGFDSWSFALVATESTVQGFAGDDSLMHLTGDDSCALNLDQPATELTPPDYQWGPDETERMREGFIEVIEMGRVAGDASAAILANQAEEAGACELLGTIVTEDSLELQSPTGEIGADVSLIDVASGINYGYPALALSEFFAVNEFRHVAPDDSSLSLDAAAPEAWLPDGDDYRILHFESGIDAVSAVLSRQAIYFTYDVLDLVGGAADVSLTLPTKRFYRQQDQAIELYQRPFLNDSSRDRQCPGNPAAWVDLLEVIWDREEQEDIVSTGGVGIRPPTTPNPSMCYGTLTMSMRLPEAEQHFISPITGSNLIWDFTSPATAVATSAGYARIEVRTVYPFIEGTDPEDQQEYEVVGLPLMGVAFQRYVNASAGPGLLAQYGGAQALKYRVLVRPKP
jgi:hypothetical protein